VAVAMTREGRACELGQK